ncbi:MAG: insulinase family protein [Myxococcales bacterium]|nr:insulinase family protein [Myxococcales bacterium]
MSFGQRARWALGAVLCLGLNAEAQTQTPPSPSAAQSQPSQASLGVAVQRGQLANGLRVVLSPDHSVPTVAIALYYDVGSRAEETGRSGFAHLFEHLMFEGTASLPKGEFDRLLSVHGADSNATTSEDRTNYYEMLPAQSLELGLWLEADRMAGLAITEEAFENQRLTVMEERRQSYQNQPYMLSFLRRDALFYEGYFPYAHATIGDQVDLEMPGVAPREQLARVRAFHTRFYAPDNAVLALAGDFDPEAAMALIRRHFDPITRRRGEVWRDPGFTPPSGERVAQIGDAHAEAPGLHMAWHVPPRRSPDHYAIELLNHVLSGGDSSRLYRRLVREREILAEVEMGAEGRRGPDIWALWAVLSAGHSLAEARREIDLVLADVVARGVTARELAKARNAVRAGLVFRLERPLQRAQTLAEYELYDGDAGLLNGELARFEAVTLADLQRVARQYLTASNRLVLEVIPEESAR